MEGDENFIAAISMSWEVLCNWGTTSLALWVSVSRNKICGVSEIQRWLVGYIFTTENEM
jgi:hypothetical protein